MVLSISGLMTVFLIQTSKAWDLMKCIQDAGYRYGLNPDLLIAIAKVESGFNARAVT